jgi:DNA polymerase-4
MRTIFHIDMDAFFASIEIVRNPSLKGKPVIVGGRPNHRGVVSTCSYEARAYGVHSAMPTSEAYRLCPHGIFLEGSYSLYREYSERIFDIFYCFTPIVEIVSIDEGYLDVTESVESGGIPRELAIEIKQQVFRETQLTCSIGIAANKLVAKIASSNAKPNGIFEVLPGTEKAFLAPLPIQSLPGVGEKTQPQLNREGIITIADLQALSLEELIHRFGSWGYRYFFAARGEDNRPVEWESRAPKSIGAETTFEHDLAEIEDLKNELQELIEKAYRRLRAHKMRTKRISVKLRFSDFKTITRSHTLSTHINEEAAIQQAVFGLFHDSYGGGVPLRLIGISFEQLSDTYWQPLLF